VLCAIGSQKQYMSLCMDTGVANLYRADLGNLSAGKGCIRLLNVGELPLETVRIMLRATLRSVAAVR